MLSRQDWADLSDALVHDARFSARALRRTPALSAMIVLLLALGVGANAATFAVADELFFRPPAGIGAPEQVHRLYLRSNWSVGSVTQIRSVFFHPAYGA